MKVYIVGRTQADLFAPRPDSRYVMPGKAEGSAFEARHKGSVDSRPNKPYEAEALIEFAGRLCYESWSMPNEATATREGYLSNILQQGHESVLEHASVTFYVEGVSRNLSHELIRHRHLSFSELSQRFVDMSEARFIIPPALIHLYGVEEYDLEGNKLLATGSYDLIVEQLIETGSTRKQAREAARSYLNAGAETKFVVTGNLRAWRDVLKKRDSEHADAEMQLFAKEVKRQLLKEYPDVFKDLT